MSYRPKRRANMRVYQHWSADVIKKLKALLLVLPVGGGKTVSVLTAILDLLEAGEVRRVLVIAPLRVAEEVWPAEIEAWLHLWSIRMSVVTGSERGRLFALQTPADVYVINRENVQWLWRTCRDLRLEFFDMLVIDESTMMQTGSQRTAIKKSDGVRVSGGKLSRFGAVLNFRKKAERVVELTGTVSPNGLASLWGQVFPLDYGERLGATKEDFTRRWFESDYMGWNKKPRKGAFEEITRRIDDIVIAPDISEHIKKIPVQFNPIWVHLSADEMARYKRFERTLYEKETDIDCGGPCGP